MIGRRIKKKKKTIVIIFRPFAVDRRGGGGSDEQERDSGSAGVEEVGERGITAGDAAGGNGDHGTVHHESRRRVYQRQDHQALSSLAPARHHRHVVPIRQESGESRPVTSPYRSTRKVASLHARDTFLSHT